MGCMTVKDLFREYKVTLRGGIAGIAAVPESGAVTPGVLLLHGFASHKDEVGDLYKRLAVALAVKGIASLRIDFHGWGESAGDMADTTVEQQLDDAQTAYAYLARMNFIDPTRIGVVGFSFGGGIAILSAAQHPGQYRSMVLWSSDGNFQKDQARQFDPAIRDRALHDGIVTVDLGWRTVTLKDAFFRSLGQFDLQQAISACTGALLVIAGRADPLSVYVEGFVASSRSETKEALVIDGADHIFGVLGDDQSHANRVVEQTVSWFLRTL